MIKVEGYKAFRGIMKIIPKSNLIPPFNIEGDFLYKPEYDCWYNKGSSYPANVCEVLEDYTKWMEIIAKLSDT